MYLCFSSTVLQLHQEWVNALVICLERTFLGQMMRTIPEMARTLRVTCRFGIAYPGWSGNLTKSNYLSLGVGLEAVSVK